MEKYNIYGNEFDDSYLDNLEEIIYYDIESYINTSLESFENLHKDDLLCYANKKEWWEKAYENNLYQNASKFLEFLKKNEYSKKYILETVCDFVDDCLDSYIEKIENDEVKDKENY